MRNLSSDCFCQVAIIERENSCQFQEQPVDGSAKPQAQPKVVVAETSREMSSSPFGIIIRS